MGSKSHWVLGLCVCSLVWCAHQRSTAWFATPPAGDGLPPPSGLLDEILAHHPKPEGLAAEELARLSLPANLRFERVLGHVGMVHDGVLRTAFTPDGRTLVSVGRQGEISTWDVVSRKKKPGEAGSACGSFHSFALSIDGRYVVVGTFEGWVCVTELSSRRTVRRWRAHDAPILSLGTTHAGEILSYAHKPRLDLVTGSGSMQSFAEQGGEVRSWRLDRESPIRELRIGGQREVRFSPDGSHVVALASNGSRLSAWDGGGRLLWSSPVTSARTLAVVDEGKRVLVVEQHRIHTLDVNTGAELVDFRAQQLDTWESCLGLTPDGRQALTASDGNGFGVVWNIASGREVERFYARLLPFCGGSFSPDGTVMASLGPRSQLWLSDAVRRVPLPDREIYSLAPSADGRRLATLGADKTVRLWDVDSGAELSRWPTAGASSLKASARLDRILVGFEDGPARLIDTAKGMEIWKSPELTWLSGSDLSPDGTRAVTVTAEQGLVMRDVRTGEALWRRPPSKSYKDNIMAFSSDGQMLVHADRGADVTLRNATDGRVLKRLGKFDLLFQVSMSPDRRFVAAYHGPTSIIEIATGKVVVKAPYRASLVAFLPGDILAVGDVFGQSIRLSQLPDDREVGKLVLPERLGQLESLAAAANGSRLLVGTERGAVLVFALRSP